mgnify:CR=1 FL=1
MQIYRKNIKKLFLGSVFVALLTALLAACSTPSNAGATSRDRATPIPTATPVTKPAKTPLTLIRMLDQTR